MNAPPTPSGATHAAPTLGTYQRLIDAITDMVSVIGEDGVYRLANDAWCRTVGVLPSQVEGRHTSEIFASSWLGTVRARAVADCLAQQAPIHVQDSRQLPNGSQATIESTYYPFGHDDLGRRCVVVVSRDVTLREAQRQALDDSAQLLRRTLDATGDAIFASDALSPDEPVRFINRQMFSMWGLDPALGDAITPRQILRRAAELFVDPEAQLARVSHIVANNVNCEDRIALRDGRMLVRRCVSSQREGEPRPVRVWSFRDITLESRARQASEHHREEMRAMLEAFPGYIAVLDERLHYTFANTRFVALMQRDAAQLIGHGVDEVLGVQRGAEVRALAAQALAQGVVVFEREQSGRVVQVTMAGFVDPAIGRVRYVGFGTDITELRAAERAQALARQQVDALLEAVPGFISALDENLCYTYVNDTFARAAGRPAADIIGRPVSEVLDPEHVGQVVANLRRLEHEARFTIERHYPAADWREPMDTLVTYARGAEHTRGRHRYYVFATDITLRKRAERDLLAAKDEAQRANLAKSQFLSHMSHELRTPLNAVLGFAQLLRDDVLAPLTANQGARVDEILRGARHLLNLINEVLDLGRIEAGKLELESRPLPLLPLLREVLALVEPLAAQHQVRLAALGGTWPEEQVIGDAVRLKQVLLNLLGNAIKYNRAGGEVRVGVAASAGRVRVDIEDTGTGLSDSQLARLFQPFERLHAADSQVEGTGIGLALSRQLMLAMRGSIGASSEPGVGSRFWIELPLAEAPALVTEAPHEAESQAAGAASGRHRVLYIEDNPVNVTLMEAMLHRLAGVEVASELLPGPGLARARAWQPDLILLDIQLPGMSGFELLRLLREDPRTRHIPVVAVSANAMPADIDEGLRAGFADYVTKPLELQRLLKVVQSALQPSQPEPP